MKTDFRRKLLCLFLVLTMLVSVCPVAAFAEGDAADEPAVEEPFDGPEDPVDEPEAPADEPEAPADEPEAPADEPEAPADEPEAPADEPEEPADEPEEPADEPEEPEDEAEDESKDSVFPGLPEGYVLSDEQLEIRENMIANSVAAELEGLTPDVDYIDGQLWFLADSEEQARIIADAYGAELLSFAYEVGVMRLKEGVTVAEAVAAAEDPALNLPPVSADYIVELEPEPVGYEPQPDASADSSSKWLSRKSWEYWRDWYYTDFDLYLKDPGSSVADGDPDDMHYQYMHEMIHSYEAWGVTQGEGILAAVLDTGVATHPDLPSIARVKVADFDEGEYPTNSHGTHVGGIIGARLGNSIGGAGIAPEVSLLSIQVLNSKGGGNHSTSVSGINAARLYGGVDVVNMSLGGKYYDAGYEQAVKNLINAGITLVCSSGNDNSNIMNYPGTFEVPGLICVGAVNKGRIHAGYSSFGPWVDIWAPGSDIWSTAPDDTYEHMNGTSMATPVVTGAVALYMARYGHTDPVTMEKVIKASVTDGILDTAKFFEKDNAPTTITVEGLVKNSAPYGAKLSFSVQPGDVILYTLDGSKPGLKDGYPTSNSRYYDPNSPIVLNADAGVAIGKKITVNALRISGFGVTCKNASLSLTVGYARPTMVKIAKPTYLIAGKSITLTASVEPTDSADQTVLWRLAPGYDNPPGASIGAKTGKLTTKASDSGTVWIQAYSAADPELCSDPVSIPLSNAQPVKKLVLMRSGEAVTKATLNYINTWRGGESMVLEPVALDAAGNPIEGLHFTWVSSAPDVAMVEKDGTVQALKPGKANITVTALDGSNVFAKCAVTVQQAVTGVSLGGPYTVAPGKTVTIQPTIYPDNAAVKKLSWSVDDSSAAKGVTVNNGKLSAPKTIANGTVISVTATATDGSGVNSSCTVIVEASVGTVAIYLDKDNPDFYGGGYEENKDGSLKSITLFSVEQDYYEGGSKSWVDSYAQLYTLFDIDSSASVIWTSSNPKVVSVYDGVIRAVGAGSATVTAKVADAGGKSAKVSVKVINPASSVTVVSSAPALNTDLAWYSNDISFDRLLGIGKSVSNKAVVGDAFGKPTNAKVTWQYYVHAYTNSGSRVTSVEKLIDDNKLIKLSNSGTVSANAKFASYVDLKTYKVFVTVKALVSGDNTWVEGSCTYWVVPLTTRIGAAGGVSWDEENKAFVVPIGVAGDPWALYAFTVTSSNPKAGTAKMSGNNLLIYYNNRDLTQVGKFVYTTIKVSTCDGSGKSVSFNAGFRLNSGGGYTITFKSFPRF